MTTDRYESCSVQNGTYRCARVTGHDGRHAAYVYGGYVRWGALYSETTTHKINLDKLGK